MRVVVCFSNKYLPTNNYYIMSTKESSSRVSVWLIVGVIVLIVLLLVWLTVADIFGDTDVAAFIAPHRYFLKLF